MKYQIHLVELLKVSSAFLTTKIQIIVDRNNELGLTNSLTYSAQRLRCNTDIRSNVF